MPRQSAAHGIRRQAANETPPSWGPGALTSAHPVLSGHHAPRAVPAITSAGTAHLQTVDRRQPSRPGALASRRLFRPGPVSRRLVAAADRSRHDGLLGCSAGPSAPSLYAHSYAHYGGIPWHSAGLAGGAAADEPRAQADRGRARQGAGAGTPSFGPGGRGFESCRGRQDRNTPIAPRCTSPPCPIAHDFGRS